MSLYYPLDLLRHIHQKLMWLQMYLQQHVDLLQNLKSHLNAMHQQKHLRPIVRLLLHYRQGLFHLQNLKLLLNFQILQILIQQQINLRFQSKEFHSMTQQQQNIQLSLVFFLQNLWLRCKFQLLPYYLQLQVNLQHLSKHYHSIVLCYLMEYYYLNLQKPMLQY